jgi:hypothetical protein
MQLYELVYTHKKRREISGEKRFFGRHTTSVTSVSRMTKNITDLVGHTTSKCVLLSTNRGCEDTFCCLTPGLLSVLHVLLPLLPSSHNISGLEGTKEFKMNCSQFNLSKEQQVNLKKKYFLKMEREHIFQVFGHLDIR